MPGKLVLAVGMGKIFGEKDKDGDNVRVVPTVAAEAQNSPSSFLLEEDMVLGYGTYSATGLVLSQQVQATLGSVPLSGWDLVQSAGSLLFPKHFQLKFKPSFPWNPFLGAKPEVMAAPQLHPQGVTHLCARCLIAPLAAPGVASRARWARQDSALTGGDRASGGGLGQPGLSPAGAVLSLCIRHLRQPRGTGLSKGTVSSSAGKPGCLRRAALPNTHPSSDGEY